MDSAHAIYWEIECAREERAHLRQCDLVAALGVRRELRQLVLFVLIEECGHRHWTRESVQLALRLLSQLRVSCSGVLFRRPTVARLDGELVALATEGEMDAVGVAASFDAPRVPSRPHRVVLSSGAFRGYHL